MRLLGLAALLFAALVPPAAATGYSDLNVGINAHNYGNTSRAIDYLTRAIAAPDLPPELLAAARLSRGEVYYENKQLELAIADFTAAIALRPDLYEGYLVRQAAYLDKGDDDHALSDLSAAIGLRPWQKLPYYSRSFIYLKKLNYERAVADITTTLKLEPDFAPGYLVRGSLYRNNLNDLSRALNDESKAIELDPKTPFAFFERGTTYQQLGDADRAIVDFQAGLALSPGQAEARLRLGMTEWEAGKGDAAIRDLDEAFLRDPRNAYGLLWLAIARQEQHAANDDLRAKSAKTDLSKWPAPLVAYYLGDKTVEQVMAGAVVAGDAKTTADQTCEAQFYVGEWRLLRGDNDAARPLLKAAASTCRPDFVERRAATSALHRSR